MAARIRVSEPLGGDTLVDTGLACYGDELAELFRFANRVPLLYQQSACIITKSVMSTAWKSSL